MCVKRGPCVLSCEWTGRGTAAGRSCAVCCELRNDMRKMLKFTLPPERIRRIDSQGRAERDAASYFAAVVERETYM